LVEPYSNRNFTIQGRPPLFLQPNDRPPEGSLHF